MPHELSPPPPANLNRWHTLGDRPLPIGTKVEYVADDRITGEVAGYGTVVSDESQLTYYVLIVKLDTPMTVSPGTLTFYVPFVPSVLKERT